MPSLSYYSPVVRFKKLHAGAVIPAYARDGDACLDLTYAPENGVEAVLRPGQTVVLETGLSIEIPPGWEAQVRSRSGLAAKSGIFILNSPGTIDSGYRGELKLIMHSTNSEVMRFPVGSRMAQICFSPVYLATIQEVEALSDSERGLGGLGSTGV